MAHLALHALSHVALHGERKRRKDEGIVCGTTIRPARPEGLGPWTCYWHIRCKLYPDSCSRGGSSEVNSTCPCGGGVMVRYRGWVCVHHRGDRIGQ